eukprot:gene21346-25640_t
MKTSLANAFAVGRLAAVQEFHLSRNNTNAPPLAAANKGKQQENRRKAKEPSTHSMSGPSLWHKFNYELFNRSNGSMHFESWNYRGCWHQTCPLIDTR